MKKLLLSALLIGGIAFTSCSEADENGCKSCEIVTITTEFCDNGDGTVTVNAGTTSTTEDLQGVSFDVFVATACNVSPIR